MAARQGTEKILEGCTSNFFLAERSRSLVVSGRPTGTSTRITFFLCFFNISPNVRKTTTGSSAALDVQPPRQPSTPTKPSFLVSGDISHRYEFFCGRRMNAHSIVENRFGNTHFHSNRQTLNYLSGFSSHHVHTKNLIGSLVYN